MSATGYMRAATLADAFAALAPPGAQLIAGGADLVPLLNDRVAAPQTLVDISRIPELHAVAYDDQAGLRLGATVTLNEVMRHPATQAHYPALAQALQESASPQVRNLATIGGNLLQQPRCPYYRDTGFPCLRRDGGNLCSALVGDTSRMALFGYGQANPHATCVAVTPSDAANALVAYDAVVELRSPAATRSVPVEEFFYAPTADPHRVSVMEPNEIITAITLPSPPANARGTYIKLRDRAAYEFAIVSATAVIAEAAGVVTHARLVLGGVAWGPHRALAAEAALINQPLTPENIARAAALALEGAQPLPDNGYKIPMAEAALRRAISGEIHAPRLVEARA